MFFGRSDHCHQWFYDGFFDVATIAFNGFSMVPDHWSNDATVSMDRCGLDDYISEQRKGARLYSKRHFSRGNLLWALMG